MEVIKDFLYKLGNEYLYWTLISIIALVIIIFLCIVLHVSKKRAKAEKSKEEFKQSALQSLTPEEIDNISNNSANPKEVKEYLTAEVVITPTEKAKTQQKEKSKTSAKTSEKQKATPKTTKTDVKKEEPKTSKTEEVKTIETKPKKQPETKKATTDKKESEPKTKKQPTTKTVSQPKKQVKEVQPTSQDSEKRKYTGKWKISQEDGGFMATLTASNGGTLLKTEKYKSLSGVKNGIETIKKNIDGGNFAISVDKYGHYRFKLFNVSNRLICVSEDYSSKNKCESGIESVKRFAKTDSVIIEEK